MVFIKMLFMMTAFVVIPNCAFTHAAEQAAQVKKPFIEEQALYAYTITYQNSHPGQPLTKSSETIYKTICATVKPTSSNMHDMFGNPKTKEEERAHFWTDKSVAAIGLRHHSRATGIACFSVGNHAPYQAVLHSLVLDPYINPVQGTERLIRGFADNFIVDGIHFVIPKNEDGSMAKHDAQFALVLAQLGIQKTPAQLPEFGLPIEPGDHYSVKSYALTTPVKNARDDYERSREEMKRTTSVLKRELEKEAERPVVGTEVILTVPAPFVLPTAEQ